MYQIIYQSFIKTISDVIFGQSLPVLASTEVPQPIWLQQPSSAAYKGLQTHSQVGHKTTQVYLKSGSPKIKTFLGQTSFLGWYIKHHYNREYRKVSIPFINSLKILKCATNQDSLLLTTLQYVVLSAQCPVVFLGS